MKHGPPPSLHRFTRHEHGRLIDQGFLHEEDPIELLDGLLLVKGPQSSPHRTAVVLVASALERAFGRVQPCGAHATCRSTRSTRLLPSRPSPRRLGPSASPTCSLSSSRSDTSSSRPLLAVVRGARSLLLERELSGDTVPDARLDL
jgi:hypothetical protein